MNAIITNSSDEVLLTLRRDTPIWCLPGGLVEVGETAATAIGREVFEEVGVVVEVLRLTGVYSRGNLEAIFPARVPTVVVAFLCRAVHGSPGTSDEVADWGYFRSNELPRPMVETHPGRVADALAGTAAVFD